jgi:hypothetical protein
MAIPGAEGSLGTILNSPERNLSAKELDASAVNGRTEHATAAPDAIKNSLRDIVIGG